MKRILVAVDLSDLSRELIRYGYAMASLMGARLDVVHVVPHPTLWKGYEPWLPPQFGQEVLEIAEKKVRRLVAEIGEEREMSGDPAHVVVLEGAPAATIIDVAKRDRCDLIVLGHRGQTALEWFLVGSTATSVARYAPCSVLIYRPEGREGAEGDGR